MARFYRQVKMYGRISKHWMALEPCGQWNRDAVSIYFTVMYALLSFVKRKNSKMIHFHLHVVQIKLVISCSTNLAKSEVQPSLSINLMRGVHKTIILGNLKGSDSDKQGFCQKRGYIPSLFWKLQPFYFIWWGILVFSKFIYRSTALTISNLRIKLEDPTKWYYAIGEYFIHI